MNYSIDVSVLGLDLGSQGLVTWDVPSHKLDDTDLAGVFRNQIGHGFGGGVAHADEDGDIFVRVLG